MNTVIKTALIAALAITSLNAQSAERFTNYRDSSSKVVICTSPDSMIDLLNAHSAGDQREIKAILRRECTIIPQANREFEITKEWRHVSEISFYNQECQLTTDKLYVATDTISTHTLEQMAKLKNKPPVCSAEAQQAVAEAPAASAKIGETYRVYEDVRPDELMVCDNLSQVTALTNSSSTDGCYPGMATEYAVLKQLNGDYAHVQFKGIDDVLSKPYWIAKDAFYGM